VTDFFGTPQITERQHVGNSHTECGLSLFLRKWIQTSWGQCLYFLSRQTQYFSVSHECYRCLSLEFRKQCESFLKCHQVSQGVLGLGSVCVWEAPQFGGQRFVMSQKIKEHAEVIKKVY
jgi:hypothetical protein